MSFTRRAFIQRMAQIGGYSAAFCAMRALGSHRRSRSFSAAAACSRFRQRKESRHPGRRHRGPRLGLRTPQSGLRMHDPRSTQPSGWPQLDRPQGQQGRVHRWRSTRDATGRAAATSTPARPNPIDPYSHAWILPGAWRPPGSRGQCLPLRFDAGRRSQRRQRRPTAPGRLRHPWLHRRTTHQIHQQTHPRRRALEGRLCPAPRLPP